MDIRDDFLKELVIVIHHSPALGLGLDIDLFVVFKQFIITDDLDLMNLLLRAEDDGADFGLPLSTWSGSC